MAVANGMRSVANARPTLCDMLPKELDTEISAKPRRSISRAVSSVARRRPGVAIRLRAGRGAGIAVFQDSWRCAGEAKPPGRNRVRLLTKPGATDGDALSQRCWQRRESSVQ